MRIGLFLLISPVAALTACSEPTAPGGLAGTRAVLASGAEHTCLLESDGRVVCWGRWRAFPDEPGAFTPPMRVIPADTSLRFVTLSADLHTCALTEDGRGFCWGRSNRHGELGDGTTVPRDGPTAVATDLRFRDIAVAPFGTCALTLEGKAYCWGRNDFGTLGTGVKGEGTFEPLPVAVLTSLRFGAIAGGTHFCAVTEEGRGYCWGFASGSFTDPWREPGDCDDVYFRWYLGAQCLVPTSLGGGRRFSHVSVGGGVACGVTGTGTAACWGQGFHGDLGNNTAGVTAHAVAPATVAGGLAFRQVSAGASHVCALTADGRPYCWGNEFAGQLGNGISGKGSPGFVFRLSPVPVAVSGNHRFVTLSVGWDHTCGLTEAGEVWCWGAGGGGELGRDPSLLTFGISNVPVRVSLP